jgi:glutamine amidotransferase
VKKKRRVCVIDYGMGNIRSVSKAFEKMGAAVAVSDDKNRISSADAVVLPGVGSFDAAVGNLRRKGLWKLLPRVIAGKPFFGICLGLQLLFDGSQEGKERGLGILPGKVRRFPSSAKLAVPHMGWNTARPVAGLPIPSAVGNLGDKDYLYFVHSYYAPAFTVKRKKDYPSPVSALSSDYGVEFCSAVSFDGVFACQFHPEKSGDVGLAIIKNFIEGIS